MDIRKIYHKYVNSVQRAQNRMIVVTKVSEHFIHVSGTSPEDAYDEKLIHPLAMKISKLFPGPPRRYVQDKITSPDKFSSSSSEILQSREEQRPCDFSKEPRYRATEFTTSNGKSPI